MPLQIQIFEFILSIITQINIFRILFFIKNEFRFQCYKG
jgi:hypothetical protein